jgi:hypothetical protein
VHSVGHFFAEIRGHFDFCSGKSSGGGGADKYARDTTLLNQRRVVTMGIIAGFALVIAVQTGSINHVADRSDDWKPGPKVAAELARIERVSRTLFRAYLDGRLNQWTVIREQARLKVEAEALREWSRSNSPDRVPELVVLIRDAGESVHAFPKGLAHLPRELVVGDVYPASLGSQKHCEYLGERRVTGIRFSIFRLIERSGP